jgi:acetylornithine deacetylase
MTTSLTSIEHSPLLKRAALVSTLQALVRIDSVNPAHGGPKGGERRVLEWAARWLEGHGIQASLSDADPDRPVLRARVEGRAAGPPLLFETHVDTVSTQGMTIDPLGATVRDGRLWGRGATDAKGQAAAMLHALAYRAALAAETDSPPPLTIELALVSDEEFGFGGARALLAGGVEARGIVVGEPTGLRVVAAHKGAARFEIEAIGKLAHAARPELGVNAISAAAALIDEINTRLLPELGRKSAPLLGPPTLNVAKIYGGSQPNLVPDACRVLVERRMLPGETADDARAEIEALFEHAAARVAGFRARLDVTSLDAAAFMTDPDGPLPRAAGAAAAGVGAAAEPIGVDYCTDASILQGVGVPMIVAGPGSIDQAHTEDEFIALDELERGARFHAQLMGWDGEG